MNTVYALDRQTVPELQRAFKRARFVLVGPQRNEDGWWAEIFTWRGPARVDGCRNSMEAIDQALDTAITFSYGGES